MPLHKLFEEKVLRAIEAIGVVPEGEADRALLSRVTVEKPRDPTHGDLATNAAMVLAKPLGAKPRELATRLAIALARDPAVEAAEVAGPGFINLRVRDEVWAEELRTILSEGAAYGRSDLGGGRAVNVEFVSANPTGPMHVGHCRGAVVGDAIAGLLEATGHAVTREYYVNDMGGQINVLARSALLRYREALDEPIEAIPSGLYPGDYLKPVGEALAREFGPGLLDRPEPEQRRIAGDLAVGMMIDRIRDDLAALAISHDLFFSERSLASPRDRIAAAIDVLREKGLVYMGRLPPPKGQETEAEREGWEDREQLLFRSTGFGDDVDRPLMKSDGSYTYFASDIAYHHDKLARGFRTLIDVWGADHGGYVKRMQAAVAALSGGEAGLEVQIVQLVRLLRAGAPVRMSKRSGDLVTLREIVDEVGRDAVRFMMLFRKSDAPLDFDFAVVTEQSKDNPVFYVQYAHARTESVRRQAGEEAPGLDLSPETLADADLTALEDAGERLLVRLMAEWPRTLELAAKAREPHRIAHYLHDLSAEFHAHWNKGKERPQLRFIKRDDARTTRARLALVTGVGSVLRAGLGVLGVTAPAEMT